MKFIFGTCALMTMLPQYHILYIYICAGIFKISLGLKISYLTL